ncbi:type I methionyl aminopeptidase [candidate division LCP-89 bacterium B3_LCP]|uniref:Methionine aminopeptidase n=1 Tax=candidate division LCP-89 bacterium B3_LCP TaxID=2012998 RepID=A0A532V0B2_UNCL8|nr:MAG: type I methionyl aminopeptidase [candidate division LCP-89 bacterium B3_LCP]
MITIKSKRDIEEIGKACEVLAEVFREVAPLMVPGARARDIDKFIEESIRRREGRPAFKGYTGADGIPFPASCCISIDAEVVHGIPGKRVFKEGQIVGLDVGVELNGYYGDAARTFLIGEVKQDIQRLIGITREALYHGIDKARKNNRLFDISHAVQTWSEKHGFSVVRELSGHGIGKSLHEEPQIPNYGSPGRGPHLHPGMVLAIEPMINFGEKEIITADDGWTVITSDGKPSAHWEETIVITEGDPLILTNGDWEN